jgi:hypothetical protein
MPPVLKMYIMHLVKCQVLVLFLCLADPAPRVPLSRVGVGSRQRRQTDGSLSVAARARGGHTPAGRERHDGRSDSWSEERAPPPLFTSVVVAFCSELLS